MYLRGREVCVHKQALHVTAVPHLLGISVLFLFERD